MHGINRVRNISDDIIIGAESIEELFNKMNIVFTRLQENNITVNKRKCKFFQSSVVYMGHVWSNDGPLSRSVQS